MECRSKENSPGVRGCLGGTNAISGCLAKPTAIPPERLLWEDEICGTRVAGFAAVVLLIAPCQAFAQSGLYVSATGGALFPEDWSSSDGTRTSFKTGYSVLGAPGLSLGLIGLRVEVEG